MATQREMTLVVALTRFVMACFHKKFMPPWSCLSAIVPPYLARWVMRQAHSLANRETQGLVARQIGPQA